MPIFYVNHVGAQTELIFDGGSLVYSPDGRLFEELPYFDPKTVNTFFTMLDRQLVMHRYLIL